MQFIGGLIILAMFINGWSVDDCANVFERLAKKAFKPRWFSRMPLLSQIPVFSHILVFIVTYLADGLYPPEDLEAALREVFGSKRSILDYSHATAIGAKVGLPVTTILETDSCLFTNYNGVGARPQDSGIPAYDMVPSEHIPNLLPGYHIVRAMDGSRRMLVWEMWVSAIVCCSYQL